MTANCVYLYQKLETLSGELLQKGLILLGTCVGISRNSIQVGSIQKSIDIVFPFMYSLGDRDGQKSELLEFHLNVSIPIQFFSECLSLLVRTENTPAIRLMKYF